MNTDLVAQALIEEQAVFLRPKEPFTWTSGVKSPIYCDNRMLISTTDVRQAIVRELAQLVKGLSPELVAGTATAGIPWAAWVAQELHLPMVYVRSSAKGHGRQNLIEGRAHPGARCVLLEDLISTGKSSLAAAQALQDEGLKVLAVVGLFHYNFPETHELFQRRGVTATALCTLDQLLPWAVRNNTISAREAQDIIQWRNQLRLHSTPTS